MTLAQRACRFPVAGVFARPTAASERQTEVVYGEIVTPLGDEESGYLRVRVQTRTRAGWRAARSAQRRRIAAPETEAGWWSRRCGRHWAGNREASLGAVFVVLAEEMAPPGRAPR